MLLDVPFSLVCMFMDSHVLVGREGAAAQVRVPSLGDGFTFVKLGVPQVPPCFLLPPSASLPGFLSAQCVALPSVL